MATVLLLWRPASRGQLHRDGRANQRGLEGFQQNRSTLKVCVWGGGGGPTHCSLIRVAVVRATSRV